MQKAQTKKSNQMQMSLFSITTLPYKGVPHLNKSYVEANLARSIVETFMVESFCELSPPFLEVKINGLDEPPTPKRACLSF
jgi:hypothetical protein